MVKLVQKEIRGSTVIQVKEKTLGADKAASFKEAIGRFLHGDNALLVLDMSEVEFIDSSGLGAILSVLKRMDKERELILCGLTEPVACMFKLTRMDRVFTIRRDADSARAAAAR